MKENINLEQFYEYIDWIEIFDALEIHLIKNEEDKLDLFIPYLMNDSVESILKIENCSFSKPLDQETDFADAYFVQIEDSDDLFLQMDEQIMVIHYEVLSLETNCFQYHNIGHNWRSDKGEEHIRRLVNLICVIHDKNNYLGEPFTNWIEKEIAPLIEFGPLAEWSPINASMLEWYSETEDGINAMKEISKEANDMEYYDLLCQYQSLPAASKQKKMIYRMLTGQLVHSDHSGIYETILDKIEWASVRWKHRDYGQEMNSLIQESRENVEREYHEKGYSGRYPHLRYYDDAGRIRKEIYFVEQLPFTRLESEDYPFRIYAMETVINAMESYSSDEEEHCRDYGFFHGSRGEGNYYQVL